MNIQVETLIKYFIHDAGQLYSEQTADGNAYYPQKGKTLTADIIQRHIAGTKTVSIQLLQLRTHLVKCFSMDFDRKSADESLYTTLSRALIIQEAFEKLGITVYIEFSGNKGFHLWGFFLESLPGSTVRQFCKIVIQLAGCEPSETFPEADWINEDGTGAGHKPIKLPCGVHNASGRRTGFLSQEIGWDDQGFPILPDNQDEIINSFSYISSMDIIAVLNRSTETGVSNDAGSKPKTSNSNSPITIDFSCLKDNEHPPCITYLVQQGAPKDVDYNKMNLTLIRYAISRKYDFDMALGLATPMAQNTSPQHPTSKKSIDEKTNNFKSEWKSAQKNIDMCQWSCGYALCSKEFVASRQCSSSECAFWSYERSQYQSQWKSTETDYLIEREVFAYILSKPETASKLILQSDVEPDGFQGQVEVCKDKYIFLHRLLWQVITGLVDKKQEIRTSLILADLEDAVKAEDITAIKVYLDFLESGVEACKLETFNIHLERIKDIGLRMRAQRQIADLSKSLTIRDIPLATTMDTMIYKAQNLQRRTAADIEPVSQHMETLVNNLFSKPVNSIPTPSSWFNNILNGGWHPSKLYVIGAPPGSGKTTFCTWCGDYAASNKTHVLYVAYEMSQDQLWINGLARAGNIDSSLIEAKRWMDSTYERVDSLQRSVGEAIKKYHNTVAEHMTISEADPEVTTAQIKGMIAKMRQRANINEDEPIIVVIDYLQLMMSGDEKLDTGVNETGRVGRIATALKQLARDTGTAVIAISDITKQAYQEATKSGNLDMSALRDSFKIAHAADVIMLLQTGTVYIGKDENIKSKDQIDIMMERYSGGDEIEFQHKLMDARTRYPLNDAAKATYARLSILKNRGGSSGEPLFVYEKAYHNFIAFDLGTTSTNMHQLSEDVVEVEALEQDGSLLA